MQTEHDDDAPPLAPASVKFVLSKLPALPDIAVKSPVKTLFVAGELRPPRRRKPKKKGEVVESRFDFVETHVGPIPMKSNYLIPGIVLMASFPVTSDLPTYVSAGFTVIASFCGSTVQRSLEKWQALSIESPDDVKPPPSNIEILHFGFDNAGVPKMEPARRFIRILADRVMQGKKLLMHCIGGRGRTGTMAGCLLCVLYPDLTLGDIFRRVQCCHDSRGKPFHARCPEVQCQFRFIEDFWNLEHSGEAGKETAHQADGRGR